MPSLRFRAEALRLTPAQTRIAAGMRNGTPFDDAARAHLLGHRVHCAHYRHREPGPIQLFTDHSAAATAGPSRGDE